MPTDWFADNDPDTTDFFADTTAVPEATRAGIQPPVPTQPLPEWLAQGVVSGLPWLGSGLGSFGGTAGRVGGGMAGRLGQMMIRGEAPVALPGVGIMPGSTGTSDPTTIALQLGAQGAFDAASGIPPWLLGHLREIPSWMAARAWRVPPSLGGKEVGRDIIAAGIKSPAMAQANLNTARAAARGARETAKQAGVQITPRDVAARTIKGEADQLGRPLKISEQRRVLKHTQTGMSELLEEGTKGAVVKPGPYDPHEIQIIRKQADDLLKSVHGAGARGEARFTHQGTMGIASGTRAELAAKVPGHEALQKNVQTAMRINRAGKNFERGSAQPAKAELMGVAKTTENAIRIHKLLMTPGLMAFAKQGPRATAALLEVLLTPPDTTEVSR